jgi:hypothetical protein
VTVHWFASGLTSAAHPVPTGSVETDLIRWLGVAAVIMGIGISAPDAVRELVHELAEFVRAVWRWFIEVLAHICPRLRPQPEFVPLSAQDHLTFSDSASASVTRAWDDDWSDAQKIDNLRNNIMGLWSALDVANEGANTRHEELLARIQALDEQQEEVAAAIHARLDKERHRDVRIDARGLPVVGIGTIMTAIPDELAHFPVVGWIVVALCAGMMLIIGWSTASRPPAASEARVYG